METSPVCEGLMLGLNFHLCWWKTPPLSIFNLIFKSLSNVKEHHHVPKQIGAMMPFIPERC